MAKPAKSLISIEEFTRLTGTELPLVGQLGMRIEKLEAGRATGRLPYQTQNLRPGGTIAGPMMMALADYVMYALVLSLTGPERAQAVTVNLNINFLSRPEPRDILGEGRIVKLGRRLAFGEVMIHSDGRSDPVAHVTASYAIPDKAPAA